MRPLLRATNQTVTSTKRLKLTENVTFKSYLVRAVYAFILIYGRLFLLRQTGNLPPLRMPGANVGETSHVEIPRELNGVNRAYISSVVIYVLTQCQPINPRKKNQI